MVDKYGKCKNNYDKPQGYGKGGVIKGYKYGGGVSIDETVKSGNRIAKMEAEAGKKLREQIKKEKAAEKKKKK